MKGKLWNLKKRYSIVFSYEKIDAIIVENLNNDHII